MNSKFAVVTGASTGIGKAVSIELAKSGYYVFLVGRVNEKLLLTKSLITQIGGQSEVIVGDLANLDSIKALIATVKQKTSTIDLLANIAGIWHGKDEVYSGIDFDHFDEKVILETYSVGLLTPTILSHAFIPLMHPSSSIINLSGTFENGAKGWLPYYVSKRAIEDLTVGLSEELKDKGIKVNCISPSDTATEEYKRFFPEDAKDAQTPEQIAKFFLEILDHGETGRVYIIKNGVVEVGFHS